LPQQEWRSLVYHGSDGHGRVMMVEQSFYGLKQYKELVAEEEEVTSWQ